MLEQATIFKDFFITANATNTAVTFEKNGALSVSVKNDNFAQQVQILDNDNNIDFFAYKYITFDDSAVFEITDCIRNGKYVTLFIQYLSNITFNEPNDNFRVDAVSVNSLQRLGLDINDLLAILGNNTDIKHDAYTLIDNDITGQQPIMYAVKLRFSELPQNLNYSLKGEGREWNNEVQPLPNDYIPNLGSLSFNQNAYNKIYPTNPRDFTLSDNAKTVIIPMPSRSAGIDIIVPSIATFSYGAADFITTLSILVSDLTLTAEITLINSKTLQILHEKQVSEMAMETIKVTTPSSFFYNDYISLPNLSNIVREKILKCLRVPSEKVVEYTSWYEAPNSALCFVLDGETGTGGAATGIAEVFNVIDLKMSKLSNNKIPLSLQLLGNTIDLSQAATNTIEIKRNSQSMRVYTNKNKEIYTDIPTTFEFIKSAYSNYEAYQKSNIDLLNNQSFETLKQQQAQQRKLQTLDSVAKGASSVGNALFAFGMGNVAGGVGQLIGGAAGVATDEIKHNMKTQNDTANAKLSAAQAHERARASITPSSEIKGSVNIVTALYSVLRDNGTVALFYVKYLNIGNNEKALIQKYAFENAITDKITGVEQIQKPTWADSYYQAKICNRSAVNTRKDLIIFVEDKTT